MELNLSPEPSVSDTGRNTLYYSRFKFQLFNFRSSLQCEEEEIQVVFQSGEVAITNVTNAHAAKTTAATVQFLDEVEGQHGGGKSTTNIRTLDGISTKTDLAEFLSRPVRIADLTWGEADLAGSDLAVIQPWYEFFNDARIKYKLNNYAFIRCNLKLKFIINASPFYYGAALATWNPMYPRCGNLIPASSAVPPNSLISLSQKPRVWIYAQNSEGGELTLPFFWDKNWLPLTSAQALKDMGVLDIVSFTTLLQANGVTGSGVTIQCYAWAEDVELSGSTVTLALQSGEVEELELQMGKIDEYDGAVSGPASAVAAAAGNLARIPVINKFATAAQVGASAVAKASSLFGFSNPPVITPSQGVRNQPFPQMASAEISYPGEKLALDPKNELTVDSTVVGLKGVDELDIKYLAGKESYLTQMLWTDSVTTDRLLFSSPVSPSVMFATETYTGYYQVYHTPLSWLAEMFNGWRGDLIFRFKIVASPYHKGRLRISWDPAGNASSNILSDAVSTTVVQTAIIDIGKDSDVEFRVPYNQAMPWLLTSHAYASSSWSVASSPAWATDANRHNGTLTLRVLTRLTGPAATNAVPIMVFVRAADMEFANPGRKTDIYWSTYELQSGEVTEIPIGDQATSVDIGPAAPSPKERFLVNYGESVTNLRALLHRTFLHRSNMWVGDTTSTRVVFSQVFPRLPFAYGFDPYGIHRAVGVVDAGVSKNFNFVNGGFFNWIARGFQAYRGGMVWTVNVEGNGYCGTVRFTRDPASSLAFATNTDAHTFTNGADWARFCTLKHQEGTGGSALTNQRSQAGLTIVAPQYSPVKFVTLREQYRGSPANAGDFSAYDMLKLEFDASGIDGKSASYPTATFYCSAAADANMLFFTGAPALKVYNANPASSGT